MRQEAIDCSGGIPQEIPENAVLHFPAHYDEKFYRERTNRNNGFIVEEERKRIREQECIRNVTVGIAGNGGMGGLLGSVFARAGYGGLCFADCETFDISNINRQAAATESTIGKSKAIETALGVRAIVKDVTLWVYPQGITEQTVEDFVLRCAGGVILDLVEFWAAGARILLHHYAKKHRVPVFNCNSVGFGTRLFCFDHTGAAAEEMLGLTLGEAVALQLKVQQKIATRGEVRHLMNRMLNAFVPELPHYGTFPDGGTILDYVLDRLLNKQQASIVATNPPMASGFLANRVLLYLLRDSGMLRTIAREPKTPGYLYFDAALMEARIVERDEVHHG